MRMLRFFRLLGVWTMVAVVALGCRRERLYDPAEVAFEVRYNGMFENLVYPSLILGLSHSLPAVMDSTEMFAAGVTSPREGAVLQVVVDSTWLNYESVTQAVLPKGGSRYTLVPQVKWRYDRLYGTRRQGNVDVTVRCVIDGEEVDVKNLHLNYRSANDCLLSARDERGKVHDFRWMFAAYVDEESGYIDEILSGMLESGSVSRIVGYQQGKDEVVAQVEGIWQWVLERGMSYASVSTTSNPAQRANVQHVRFFEEVYNLRQANCIDACVFFASVMRRIGLKPVIMVVPGHAYLGYYTDKERRNMKLLETTVSQWVNLPLLTREYERVMAENPQAKGAERLPAEVWEKYRKYLSADERARWQAGTMGIEELKRCVGHYLFGKATEYNVKGYKESKAAFADEGNYQYQMLDIEVLRAFVQPI